MLFEKQFKIKYILLFVLLICLVFVFSYLYYFYPKKKILSDNIIANPSDTEQWQTYTNEEFHCSIKYPPGWTMEESGDVYYPPSGNVTGITAIYLNSKPEFGFINIVILYNKKQLPLDQALKEGGWKDIEEKCILVEINKQNALKCMSDIQQYRLDFIFGYKDLLYWIHWGSWPNTDENYLKQLQSIVPEFELPEYIYNSALASKDDLEKVVDLENKVIEKIVSTFRILEY